MDKEYLISDIALHIDKILIRLEKGSLIHLPLEMLTKVEIQSLKNKQIKALSIGKSIVFTEIPK